MEKMPYYVTIEELQSLVDEAYLNMLDKEIAYNEYKQAMDIYVQLRTKLNEEKANQSQLKLKI